MFSVDNFYDYLMHYCTWPLKDNFLHVFKTHGSRDLHDIVLWHRDIPDFYNNVRNKQLERYYGGIYMFDQEPIDFDQLYFDQSNPRLDSRATFNYCNYFNKIEQFVQKTATVLTPIICHSEQRSDEVQLLESLGFLTVHYWWHGLIARDWYRHWKHYTPLVKADQRLGCYIRDTSGTRQYRKNLLNIIAKEKNIYCPLLRDQRYHSDASAMLEWNDTGKFDIHIVAETLFDTQKTHLTEKVLKPVAMEQPFILFAGPHSLEYMRSYGFQTFSCCWDESYDAIEDSQERYDAIVDLIKHLNSLNDLAYSKILKKAKLIAINNREHFYSSRFEDTLLAELHTNLNKAFDQQKIDQVTNPGGMFFNMVNTIKGYNEITPQRWVSEAQEIFKFIEQRNPKLAKQILKQYPDLF